MEKKTSSIYIKVIEGDNANRALRRFKRMCDEFGISKEYRKRKHHRKPSLKKKEKLEAAEKRKNKENRKRVRYSKI